MNIFVLDLDPEAAASAQCDKHVVKMVLESAQLLCGPFPTGQAPYKRTHYNHPCAMWTRASAANYLWLGQHARALAHHYTLRFGKVHKSAQVVEWCLEHMDQLALPQLGLTPFAQAMPTTYQNPCAVTAYRDYYMREKASIARWQHSVAPEWWPYSG